MLFPALLRGRSAHPLLPPNPSLDGHIPTCGWFSRCATFTDSLAAASVSRPVVGGLWPAAKQRVVCSFVRRQINVLAGGRSPLIRRLPQYGMLSYARRLVHEALRASCGPCRSVKPLTPWHNHGMASHRIAWHRIANCNPSMAWHDVVLSCQRHIVRGRWEGAALHVCGQLVHCSSVRPFVRSFVRSFFVAVVQRTTNDERQMA